MFFVSSSRIACGGLIALVLSGCPADVDTEPPEDGGGSATGGAGGAGGGELATSHPVEIAALLTPPYADPDLLLVVVSTVDGKLVQSFRGSELPVTVDVVDGDLVTYAHALDFDESLYPRFLSYRVTPEVDRIETQIQLAQGQSCEPGPAMFLHISLPPLPPDADAFGIQYRRAPGYQTVGEYAADEEELALIVTPCADERSIDFLIDAHTADGTIVAYQLLADVPYRPGTSPAFSVDIQDTERAQITVDVDGFSEPVVVTGQAAFFGWSGAHGVTLFVEDPLALPVESQAAPFSFTATPIAPGHGSSQAWVHLAYPPLDGVCRAASFNRSGSSPTPLAFHAEQLAEPGLVGADTWVFASDGELGDNISLSYEFGDGFASWYVLEDARRPPLPAVFPELPGELPEAVMALDGAPVARHVSHHDADELATYADLVRWADFWAPYTGRGRSQSVCP